MSHRRHQKPATKATKAFAPQLPLLAQSVSSVLSREHVVSHKRTSNQTKPFLWGACVSLENIRVKLWRDDLCLSLILTPYTPPNSGRPQGQNSSVTHHQKE